MDFDIYQMRAMQDKVNDETVKKQKTEEFIERIKAFGDVHSIQEAKDLASKILPVANETNKFSVGNAKCTIINRKNSFRICLDTPDEFISYDFSK